PLLRARNPTRFPYTTLFRSAHRPAAALRRAEHDVPDIQDPARPEVAGRRPAPDDHGADRLRAVLRRPWRPGPGGARGRQRDYARSEEHTSELQSRVEHVCRL